MHPWKVLSHRSLLKIVPWLEVVREQVQLPDGQVVDDYYTIRLPEYSVVVALTPDGRVVAERHYKHGLRAVSLSLPAGYLADGEEPLRGAQRELSEETGYTSDRWLSLGRFVVDGNRGCGVAHFFLARDCAKVCQPDNDDLEEIQVELLAFDEMLDAIRFGQALEVCTATAVGLAYMELSRHGY